MLLRTETAPAQATDTVFATDLETVVADVDVALTV
jgi:hypothetical protein